MKTANPSSASANYRHSCPILRLSVLRQDAVAQEVVVVEKVSTFVWTGKKKVVTAGEVEDRTRPLLEEARRERRS